MRDIHRSLDQLAERIREAGGDDRALATHVAGWALWQMVKAHGAEATRDALNAAIDEAEARAEAGETTLADAPVAGCA
jgi:hypothetical protein